MMDELPDEIAESIAKAMGKSVEEVKASFKEFKKQTGMDMAEDYAKREKLVGAALKAWEKSKEGAAALHAAEAQSQYLHQAAGNAIKEQYPWVVDVDRFMIRPGKDGMPYVCIANGEGQAAKPVEPEKLPDGGLTDEDIRKLMGKGYL